MGLCCVTAEGPINMKEVDLSHFTMLSTVGKGGFGKVKAAQDRKDPTPKYDDPNDGTSFFYAMKLQDLRELIRKESHWRAAWVERTVMAKVTSPFVVKLHYAFVSSMDLVLVMPFLRGGDLNFYLENSGPMSEEMARFYSAEILLGLEAIHKLHFVYRDLKPENCLLDAKGHLYISDLGLATLLQERDKRYNNELFSRRYPPPHHLRTRGCCGTPGYVAPEVINRHSYGFMPDFFTFGATIARMLMRRNPFDPKLMDRHRIRGQKYVFKEDFPPPRLPANASTECKDFVHKLCAFYDEKRLGGIPESNKAKDNIILKGYKTFWKEVRKHPFYTSSPGWDWKKIEERKIKPPHTPSLQRLNFNPVYEAEEQIMAEGRKPLDKAEREKVNKVFHDIGFKTEPPFKNSAGEIWPKVRPSQTQKSSKTNVPNASASAMNEEKKSRSTNVVEAKFEPLQQKRKLTKEEVPTTSNVTIHSKAKGIDFEAMESKRTGSSSPMLRSTAPSFAALPGLGSNRKSVKHGGGSKHTPPPTMPVISSLGEPTNPMTSIDVARDGSISGKRESKATHNSEANPLTPDTIAQKRGDKVGDKFDQANLEKPEKETIKEEPEESFYENKDSIKMTSTKTATLPQESSKENDAETEKTQIVSKVASKERVGKGSVGSVSVEVSNPPKEKNMQMKGAKDVTKASKLKVDDKPDEKNENKKMDSKSQGLPAKSAAFPDKTSKDDMSDSKKNEDPDCSKRHEEGDKVASTTPEQTPNTNSGPLGSQTGLNNEGKKAFVAATNAFAANKKLRSPAGAEQLSPQSIEGSVSSTSGHTLDVGDCRKPSNRQETVD